MIKWMFDEYIPGLKYNKWQIECDRLSEQRGRPLHDFEKQAVARNIQNFYGEMNERLLGRSGTVTSALRIIFSAPGYGEGNFRAIYGSMSVLRAMFPGQPKTTLGGYKNVQFIATSVANVIALSAIGTWIMTGKPPAVPKNGNDVRDLMKIKTDTVDGNGDTIYYDMAGYTSDYFSVYGNLLTGSAIRPDGFVSATGTPSRPLMV